MAKLRGWLIRCAGVTAACAALALSIAYAGMGARLFRAPYPELGKAVAWRLGSPEPAYNFDVVKPGALFRSGAPDARFVRYLHETYGVQRIVSLAGPYDAHDTARELGVDVRVFDWKADRLPLQAELERVLELIDFGEPVLVHCRHGAVRAGYAMVVYRVLRDNWFRERAVREMARYGHDPERTPVLNRELEELLSGAESETQAEPGGARTTG